jgi:ATP-dependent DNA helicase
MENTSTDQLDKCEDKSIVTDFSYNKNSKISKLGTITKFDTKSEFKLAQQLKKQNRLKYLLEQASVYSKFLSSKFIKNRAISGDSSNIESLENVNNVATIQVSQPALISGGTLKAYQLEGLEWLVSLYENGLNGILADEMGLGKTLQCISFLAFLREKGVFGPFLIAAPLSTLSNWESEIKRFAPSLPCIVYHGNKTERAELRQKHFGSANGRCKIAHPETFPVIITSYEIIMNDKSYLDNFRWKFIIVDEGHRIKNLNCKLIKILKEFDSANRLLLTGTPLQNNLAELWSLLNFLLPDIFDDLEVFQRWFDVSEIVEDNVEEISCENRVSIVSNLHNILRPFLLRRLKIDVEKDLPPKREYIIYCNMSPLQLQYYNAALTKSLPSFVECQAKLNMGSTQSGLFLKNSLSKKRTRNSRFNSSIKESEDDTDNDAEFLKIIEKEADYTFEHSENDSIFLTKSNENDPIADSIKNMKLQNIFMQLRKVCNHPYLFFYPYNVKTNALNIDINLIKCSGKLIILDQLLPELIKRKHRTLIFSQMTGTMDILEDYLNMKSFNFCRIDGSTPQVEREKQINEFRSNSNIPVFLLSTRAAGLGINLVSADTVIFYDSDWNPQMDLQAQDRAHRIGQTKPVLIYRLASADSIESKILERASSKRKLEKVVIHKSKFKGIEQLAKNSEASIQADELSRILSEESSKYVMNSDFKNMRSKSIKLSDKELSILMDRSDHIFLDSAPELDSEHVRIAKPISGDLNDSLATM